MKKVNNMTVFESTDKCSLDEYSGKMAIEVPELIKKAKEEVNQKVIEISENDIKQDNEISTLKNNYTKLQEQNTKLEEQIKKDRENMINLEVEGQSIHIEDSSDLEGQLEVLGNVEQDVREGYNLYDYMSKVIATANGLTITKDIKNGYLIVNGTPEVSYLSVCNSMEITNILKDKATYTLWQEKYDNKLYLQVVGTKKDGTGNTNFFSASQKTAFTVDKSKYSRYAINIQIGLTTQAGTFNNYKNRYMIYEGTEEKPYEPYGASPSLEHPSTVRAVGDKGSVEIKKQNKNLFDILKYPFTNKVAYAPNGQLNYWLGYCGITEYFPVEENSNYVFSNDLNKPITYGLMFYNKNKEFISGIVENTTKFITPKNCKYIRFSIQSDTIPNKVQIEHGDKATEIVEHQEQTKILPIQKPMLEGDYFIKETDGWKEVHNWGKKIFDGTENWDTYEDTQPNTIGFGYNYRDGQKNFVGLSNYFIPYNTDYMPGRLDKDIEGLVIRYNYIKISRFKREIPNVESLKKWLKDIYDLGKPLYVYYKLDVPTKLPCTPEQTKILDELDNFQTYKPVTNITTDSIAKIKLKYIADTKTYIDNKTSNLEQQVNTINQLLSTTRTSSVLLDNLQTDIEREVL